MTFRESENEEEEEEPEEGKEREKYLQRLLDNILVYGNPINNDSRKVDEDGIPYLQAQDFPFVANYLLNKTLVKCNTSDKINPRHHHTDQKRKELGGKEAEKGRGKGKKKSVPLLGQEEVLLE